MYYALVAILLAAVNLQVLTELWYFHSLSWADHTVAQTSALKSYCHRLLQEVRYQYVNT